MRMVSAVRKVTVLNVKCDDDDDNDDDTKHLKLNKSSYELRPAIFWRPTQVADDDDEDDDDDDDDKRKRERRREQRVEL